MVVGSACGMLIEAVCVSQKLSASFQQVAQLIGLVLVLDLLGAGACPPQGTFYLINSFFKSCPFTLFPDIYISNAQMVTCCE